MHEDAVRDLRDLTAVVLDLVNRMTTGYSNAVLAYASLVGLRNMAARKGDQNRLAEIEARMESAAKQCEEYYSATEGHSDRYAGAKELRTRATGRDAGFQGRPMEPKMGLATKR